MSDEQGNAVPRAHSTMRDVAALAGVGLKTVSRVINEEPNVSPNTIERVREAARQLDYRPDIYAGNLKRSDRKTRTIGLVVGSVANPFSAAVNRGVEDVAAERGTAVFASSLDDDATRESRIVSEMLHRRVDALILTTVRRNQSHLVREQERGTVLVFVDRQPIGIAADVVVTDNFEAAAEGTSHLLAHGHRRLAYLGDLAALWTAQERKRGFLAATEHLGRERDATTVVEDLHDERSAALAVHRLLDSDNPPTALFAAQNLVTVGAIRALRERRLQHSIALLGFDDLALADLLEPGITVLAQDPYQIGRRAAERAFARLDGDRSDPHNIVVKSTLVQRGSGEIRPRADG
ncbi:MAG: LacI family DNA-binding transcriptional regulator [Pseudolysinimonas sp.]